MAVRDLIPFYPLPFLFSNLLNSFPIFTLFHHIFHSSSLPFHFTIFPFFMFISVFSLIELINNEWNFHFTMGLYLIQINGLDWINIFSCSPWLEHLAPRALILLSLWRYISHVLTHLLTYIHTYLLTICQGLFEVFDPHNVSTLQHI